MLPSAEQVQLPIFVVPVGPHTFEGRGAVSDRGSAYVKDGLVVPNDLAVHNQIIQTLSQF